MLDARMIVLAVAALVSGCAMPPVANQEAKRMPSSVEDWQCRFEGLYFEEMAKQRDNQVALADATPEVSMRFRSMATTPDEMKTVRDLTARSGSIAALAYSLKTLSPATMRYFGLNVCLMKAAGDKDPDNAVKLSQRALDCQKEFPSTSSAENDLGACIGKHAMHLIGLAAK